MTGTAGDNICKGKRLALFAGLALLYFLLQLRFANDAWFVTDELDVTLMGKALARGQKLYSEAFSQHMPVMYYISAFFEKVFGAGTVLAQRFCFYGLFAVLWAAVAVRYRRWFNKTALVFAPFVYFFIIQLYDMGTQVLADHLAAPGAVMLLMEFVKFRQERRIDVVSACWISLSILITFGGIFVAAFGIAFVLVGVMLSELVWAIKARKETAEKSAVPARHPVREYAVLIALCLLPFAVMAVVWLLNGRLDDAFYGIYTVNRVEYPAYNGGVGASVLAMFLQPIVMPFRFLIDSFPLSRYEAAGHRLLQAAVLCAGIFSLIWQSRKVGEVGFVTLWLATFGFAVRGLFNFHDSPCMALLAVWITAAAVDMLLELPKKRKTLMTAGRVVFALGVLICCLDIYDLWLVAHRQPVPDLTFPQYHTEDARVLAELTDPDEEVWALSFANDALMVADRLPCGNAVNTPWTWVKIGRKQFEAIQDNPPRVAYYRDDFYVPGFPLDGYAPETIRFLKDHYERVEGTEYVWVYKD